MRRHLKWFGIVGGLAVMVAWFCWLKPRYPQIEMGPHKADVRWISFEEAHPKKLISFTWPTGTPFSYPRHGLPGEEEGSSIERHSPELAESAAYDDPEFVAGYLLINADWASLHRDTDTEVGGYWKDKGTVLITVGYATSAQMRKGVVRLENEEFDIVLPYDPTKTAARTQTVTQMAGPYKLRFSFDHAESSRGATVIMKAVNAPSDATFCVEDGWSMSGGPNGFLLQGIRLPSGDIRVEGSISPAKYPYKSTPGKTYPFSVILRLRPPPR